MTCSEIASLNLNSSHFRAKRAPGSERARDLSVLSQDPVTIRVMGGTGKSEVSWRAELADKLSLATLIALSVGSLISYAPTMSSSRVLCTDAVMPGAPVRDVIAALKRKHPNAGVVVISGYVTDELTRRGIEQGHFRVPAKPFEPHRLLEIIDELRRGPVKHQEPMHLMA
jgi:CheY-like chemotaxis protein